MNDAGVKPYEPCVEDECAPVGNEGSRVPLACSRQVVRQLPGTQEHVEEVIVHLAEEYGEVGRRRSPGRDDEHVEDEEEERGHDANQGGRVGHTADAGIPDRAEIGHGADHVVRLVANQEQQLPVHKAHGGGRSSMV